MIPIFKKEEVYVKIKEKDITIIYSCGVLVHEIYYL